MARSYGWNPAVGTWDASMDALKKIKMSDDNVREIVLGMPGDGKSLVAVNHDYNIACYESIWDHGEPDHWEEYFNLDENAAIADQDKLIMLINKNMPRGSIILADELHMMVNARDYRDMANRIVNMFFQLMRPSGYILTGTTLEQIFIDKQSRRLFNYVFDLGNSPKPYEYNANMGKCRLPSPDPLDPYKTFFPFPRANGKIVDMVVGLRPPASLEQKYKRIRAESMKAVADKKLEELTRIKDYKEQKMEHKSKSAEIDEMLINNPTASNKEIAKDVHCDPTLVSRRRSMLNL